MADPVNPRCRRAWLWLGLANLASFTYLESQSLRRGCHNTLSRDLRAVLGRRGCYVFAVLGPLLTFHLLDLEDPDALV